MHYYNENDPDIATWLKNLIDDELLPIGVVDTRSIVEVTPKDLKGFTQHHFFAGIGGWPLALRLAGWPDDRPVWTASLPCQPFSLVGKGGGVNDERHLWPVFLELCKEYRPECIFGEQVTGAIRLGWFDTVHTDLEREGYSVGAAILGAHSVGSPQRRPRLFWVGHSNSPGLQGHLWDGGHEEWEAQSRSIASTGLSNYWDSHEWRDFKDGRKRPIRSGSFPLAHGIPNRVVRLRGYGNAIVPQVGAVFIRAAQESINDMVTNHD